MSSGPCADTLWNPFCINPRPSELKPRPTDPYSWYQDDDGTWHEAMPWQASMTYFQGEIVSFSGQMFSCNAEGRLDSTTGPASGPKCFLEPNSFLAILTNEWVLRNSLNPTFPNFECDSKSSPLPDPQSGACEHSETSGVAARCVNPCIRLANGKLAVNKFASQCRVFPNATTGGQQDLTKPCPTVCPSACIELWEQCPQGTAILTTLAQTKTIADLMSLTGPLRADGSPNPLWPPNYNTETGALGKPYLECYPFNVSFCEIPSSRQQTLLKDGEPVVNPLTLKPIQVCYSNCQPGTTQNKSNPLVCDFIGDHPVMCNPQFFDPYYELFSSKQTGCIARALPTKNGSTCIYGSYPVVNENMNIEWCLPTCPAGFINDLSHSTCIATCSNSVNAVYDNGEYNVFLDYVDFYATTNRCILEPNGTQESDCALKYVPGRCPAIQRIPATSLILTQKVDIKSKQYNTVPIRADSINLTGDPQLAEFVKGLKRYQDSNAPVLQGTTVACPQGMRITLPGTGDTNLNPHLCYDECLKGYEPFSFCNNGQASCSENNRVFACRAKCPDPSEGLGPWRTSSDGLSCEYQYPGVLPQDPSLWVLCPEDGRYAVLQASPSDIGTVVNSGVNRQPPMCVRNFYLKQSACPIGFNAVKNAGADAAKYALACAEACNSNEALILTNNSYVCQATSSGDQTSGRHDFDLIAASDTDRIADNFKSRVLTRKSFSKSVGQDPNNGLPNNDAPLPGQPTQGQSLTRLILLVVGGVALVLILKLFTGGKKSSD